MAASDAIVIGDDWISEHYLTTDAPSQSFTARVLTRRKEWDAAKQKGIPSTRSRFTEHRGELEQALASFDGATDATDVSAFYDEVLRVLGYTSGGARWQAEGPVRRLVSEQVDEPSALVVIEAKPVGGLESLLERGTKGDAPQTMLMDVVPEDGEPITAVTRLLTALMVGEDAPQFALVLAGRWVLLTDRERWPEGRYLAVNLQLVAERNDAKRGGEIDRALTILDAESLVPALDTGEIWWSGVLEDSSRHTIGVSQDLRDGVRKSIEIIANEVVARRRSQGLPPLPKDQAQPLAVQSLRFLYRILFMLYAEASPELGVLPVGAAEYDEGYSLDRLRELALVAPDAVAADGTHLHESLSVLFRLVDRGHSPQAPGPLDTTEFGSTLDEGLTFHSLRADLFHPNAVALIHETGLGNAALQEVLSLLLLSKERKGRDRGFISYAELGINQLGAVYEGLMSYTGFFAEDDLYEVAKGGNSEKGSWVVPVSRAEGIAAADFVTFEDADTGQRKRVLHQHGSFVYRLAGRERQQSASFYTPEVLTKFVVSQALEELLDQDGETTPASRILELTVCEPALGSGAFAIEAVRQLAEQYLTRRQAELGERIDPESYQRELQQVKASIALHQVHGVDLNSTAVELAEISLWLDTMVAGLDAPWFGLHLRRGNSLIGARRAVFLRADVERKAHLTEVPRDVSVAELKTNLDGDRIAGETSGSIHHFLLPHEGWGSAVDAKEAKPLAPEALAALKAWRGEVRKRPSKKQIDSLTALAFRVERLWQLSLRRIEIAEEQIRRPIAVWGAELPAGGAVTREEIEAALNNADGAYQRLRLVMDAWCAMWFWPLTESATQGAQPPTIDEWITALEGLLGVHVEARTAKEKRDALARAKGGSITLLASATWNDLALAEEIELDLSGAQRVADVIAASPWLRVVQSIASRQGFFHWELDFAAVFERGGFDLQVGNPPWVRPRSDVDALLSEGDPWWQLTNKPSQAQIAAKRPETLNLPGIRDLVVEGTSDVAATAAFVGSPSQYPHLTGLQPDLYRCFMEQTWRNGSPFGITTLIHPESHFTDEKARPLRSETYSRLRRHWQFINELQLYAEIDHHVSYGVHVYGAPRERPSFQMATSLYHPDTVERSLVHNGVGSEPGLKNADGKWDVSAHRGRITLVNEDVLATWHAVLEDEAVPVRQTRMVYSVNTSTSAVLAKLAAAPRLGQLGLEFSRGWDESIDRKNGFFEKEWGAPDSWRDVILQGPHLFVSTPFYKSPNSTMLHNQDWSDTDFETLPADAIPVTSYKPAGGRALYDAAYTRWSDGSSARDHYRIAWRKMAATTGARTLISALIPPGVAHIDGVYTAIPKEGSQLVPLLASMSSILHDTLIRVVPGNNIRSGPIVRLPQVDFGTLSDEAAIRVLRLNALTDAYATIWAAVRPIATEIAPWVGGIQYSGRPEIGDVSEKWNSDVPLRRASDRRQAQLEIDAIVALSLGITADELCTVYRTQFPVLYGYDRREYLYDANGRLVPMPVQQVWRKKGDSIAEAERTHTNASDNTYVYELPFVNLDREADMRAAYSHFERIMEERS
ncbi:DNA methyltransferase [Pseudoclavibacter terrae]|uniref:site-specific DNA-methyltransferase (adenine-specific) n=1 Tax=Pseudoclavibacter terrae TaxID=1530195 RepID=A0A7J5AZ16_9MICO|nr:DNA methyltransferase [Pseudoclavibacter terrae]KAB1636794.1 class I SAM-dependent DNA methyltransferase [Pseudoclavibacter terrae]